MKQAFAIVFLIYLLGCGVVKNAEWIWRGVDWLNEKIKDWLWAPELRKRGKG